MTQPTPGWYPDPSGAPGQRYFDGRHWAPRPTPLGPRHLSYQERADLLNATLARDLAVPGVRVESHTPHQAVLVYGSNPNHVLHVLLTIFTCGLWLIAWIAFAIFQRERRLTVMVDPYGNVVRNMA